MKVQCAVIPRGKECCDVSKKCFQDHWSTCYPFPSCPTLVRGSRYQS